ncbi:MAG: hypothetical protein RLZZ511_1670 [Cyanobacteriota bacterium]|jgi:hypothetical protein
MGSLLRSTRGKLLIAWILTVLLFAGFALSGMHSIGYVLALVWAVGAGSTALVVAGLGSLVRFGWRWRSLREGGWRRSLKDSLRWFCGGFAGGCVAGGVGLLLYTLLIMVPLFTDLLVNALRSLPGQRQQYQEVFLLYVGFGWTVVSTIGGVVWGAKSIQRR